MGSLSERFSPEVKNIYAYAMELAYELNQELTPIHLFVSWVELTDYGRYLKDISGRKFNWLKFFKSYEFPSVVLSPAEAVDMVLHIARSHANASMSELVQPKHLFKALLDYFTNPDYMDDSLEKFLSGMNIPVFIFDKFASVVLSRASDVESDYLEDEFSSQDVSSFEEQSSDLIDRKTAFEDTALEEFGFDFSEEVEKRMFHPVFFREKEVKLLEEILLNKDKKHPVITGAPGVGKTALVEAFVQNVKFNKVSKELRNAIVYKIDLLNLLSGMKGDVADRFERIISDAEKVRDRIKKTIIFFIDDFHLAFLDQNYVEFSSVFREVLADGEFPFIVAVNEDDYKKFLEKDPLIFRYTQRLHLNELSVSEVEEILFKTKVEYETFHGVTYDDEAVKAAVSLSDKYIKDRALPDKAFLLIDRAASHINVEYKGKRKFVTIRDMLEVTSAITSIPVESLRYSDADVLLNLSDRLKKHIVGQEHAIEQLVEIIKLAKKGLTVNERRPDGVFLFFGPSGVGKTELARSLAVELFGSEDHMLRLDMSEYMEKHNISKLIGSPPGYVDSEKDGVLTDFVRHNPYSIILIDELEKAHPDVQNLFLQIFDSGRIRNAQGVLVDFSHTTIIATTNAGSSNLQKFLSGIGFESKTVEKMEKKDYISFLREYFAVEFLNRFDALIPFRELSRKDLVEIARMKLGEVLERLERAEGRKVEFGEDVLNFIVDKGYSRQFGAREINRAIEEYALKPLSQFLIEHPDETNVVLKVRKTDSRIIPFAKSGKKSLSGRKKKKKGEQGSS